MSTKWLAAMTDRSVHDVLGAEHIRLDRLARMAFQQRQMLMRSGVKDQLGPDGGEDLAYPPPVADVSDDDLVRVQQAAARHLELQPMQVRLIVVEQIQRCWLEAADLTAQLAPY